MTDVAAASPLRTLTSPTAGYVAIGVSAFALLAAGPRVLGPDAYSDLAVAWTVSTIFGFGIAIPGEQTVIRGVAGNAGGNVASRVRTRLLLATLPLLACLVAVVGGADVLGVDSATWWVAMVVASIAWALLMGPRGTLAGCGDYRLFGAVLACEAVTRVLLVVAAFLVPRGSDAAVLLLAAAVGVPLLIAGVAAMSLVARRRGGAAKANPPPDSGTFGEQSSLTVVALAMQVLLNSAPLWLSARPDVSTATAGLYVSVTSYMRIPALFVGGALAVVLSAASQSHAYRDHASLRASLRYHLRVIGLLTAALILLLIIVSPVGLAILYSDGTQVGVAVLIVVGLGTLLFSLGNLATQTLVGMRRAGTAALVWVAAAIVATMGLATLSPTLMGASVAVLGGIIVGCAGVGAAVLQALRPTGREGSR